jgi:hypothetical protein
MGRFGGSGRTDAIASKNCAVVACQSSMQRSPPVHRRGSGACLDTNPCATTISTPSVCPDSPRLRPSLTQSNRRGTDPYARWWGRGGIARCPLSRSICIRTVHGLQPHKPMRSRLTGLPAAVSNAALPLTCRPRASNVSLLHYGLMKSAKAIMYPDRRRVFLNGQASLS